MSSIACAFPDVAPYTNSLTPAQLRPAIEPSFDGIGEANPLERVVIKILNLFGFPERPNLIMAEYNSLRILYHLGANGGFSADEKEAIINQFRDYSLGHLPEFKGALAIALSNDLENVQKLDQIKSITTQYYTDHKTLIHFASNPLMFILCYLTQSLVEFHEFGYSYLELARGASSPAEKGELIEKALLVGPQEDEEFIMQAATVIATISSESVLCDTLLMVLEEGARFALEDEEFVLAHSLYSALEKTKPMIASFGLSPLEIKQHIAFCAFQLEDLSGVLEGQASLATLEELDKSKLHFLLGKAYLAQNQPERALLYLEDAYERAPSDAIATCLIQGLLQSNQIGANSRAIALLVEHPLCSYLPHQRQVERAILILDEADEKNAMIRNLIEKRMQINCHDDLPALLHLAITLNPEDVDLLTNSALYHIAYNTSCPHLHDYIERLHRLANTNAEAAYAYYRLTEIVSEKELLPIQVLFPMHFETWENLEDFREEFEQKGIYQKLKERT
ncbi:MAG: hypothetical protein S4CHLAM102_03490 [Chlamydiia bacterium]|nr:hypothetical protein [Chlamydiia bacterium]